jgi:hypothetical protein
LIDGRPDGLRPLIWAVVAWTGSSKLLLPMSDDQLVTLVSTVDAPDGLL